MKFSDFKDYLSRNLDSDYLVSSILADDVDGGAFVEGIEQFRTLSPTLRETILSRITNFELVTVAGIDVSSRQLIISRCFILLFLVDNSFCILPMVFRFLSDLPDRYIESSRTRARTEGSNISSEFSVLEIVPNAIGCTQGN